MQKKSSYLLFLWKMPRLLPLKYADSHGKQSLASRPISKGRNNCKWMCFDYYLGAKRPLSYKNKMIGREIYPENSLQGKQKQEECQV